MAQNFTKVTASFVSPYRTDVTYGDTFKRENSGDLIFFSVYTNKIIFQLVMVRIEGLISCAGFESVMSPATSNVISGLF